MEDNETVKTMVPYTQLTNDLETFYVKLTQFLDPFGLTLIFNVREAPIDLYLLYLEVTRRGGYHQVGQEKKWGDVASALKLEGNNPTLCAQVEKLYRCLLYEFEKLYFYRSTATQTATGSTKDYEDYLKAAKISKDYSSHITGDGYQEPQVFQQAPSNDKEQKKRRGAPRGQSSAYQIFLKRECARLKAYHREIGGRKQMAIDAWKKMSDIDKKPYVEESEKIKEKNKEAMIIDNEQKSTQDLKRPKVCGDYHY